MTLIALPSVGTPCWLSNRAYDHGVTRITGNESHTGGAYKAFQKIHSYDRESTILHWFWPLPHSVCSEYVTYNTGTPEENIRALEPNLDIEIINEISGSADAVTSISYLYKFMSIDILVVEVYSDGSIYVSKNANFTWKNNRTEPLWDVKGDPEHFNFVSVVLYNELLNALVNIEPEHLPESNYLESGEYGGAPASYFGSSSLEYLNVTIDGVPFSTFGYRKVDENSIFGATIEDAILQILDQADEGENQISYEEFGESIVPKHEEVGNTSLTNYRWLYYYYGYNWKSAL